MVRHHYQRELLSLGYPFADVLAKAALSPQLFIGRGLSQRSLALQTGLLPNIIQLITGRRYMLDGKVLTIL